jgi:hypothetical protein
MAHQVRSRAKHTTPAAQRNTLTCISIIRHLLMTAVACFLQELVDAAKQQLVSNRQLLLQLSARSGLQVQQEDSAFSSFTQAVSEWDNQAAAHAAGAGCCVHACFGPGTWWQRCAA